MPSAAPASSSADQRAEHLPARAQKVERQEVDRQRLDPLEERGDPGGQVLRHDQREGEPADEDDEEGADDTARQGPSAAHQPPEEPGEDGQPEEGIGEGQFAARPEVLHRDREQEQVEAPERAGDHDDPERRAEDQRRAEERREDDQRGGDDDDRARDRRGAGIDAVPGADANCLHGPGWPVPAGMRRSGAASPPPV